MLYVRGKSLSFLALIVKTPPVPLVVTVKDTTKSFPGTIALPTTAYMEEKRENILDEIKEK